MSLPRADAVVIGAGVIGLAVARRLAQSGHEVLLLEANGAIGMETSSRNSGVIHSGIYYAPNSVKARSCIRGRRLLYDYCRQRRIPHRRCGKLIVAVSPGQQAQLKKLQQNAMDSGVEDLQWRDRASVRSLEPQVRAHAALLAPSTGIIDVHELMYALLADFENAGGTLVTHARVRGGTATGGGIELTVDSGGPMTLNAAIVINAAGHGASAIAASISGMPAALIPSIYPVRGHYFEAGCKLPFSRLVYPLPGDDGLGVHATLDLAGQGRFGPDAEYCTTLDYRFDESRKPSFVKAIRQWYPELDSTLLRPGYVGIRPKLQGPNNGFRDFMIAGPAVHGVNGLVNLFGIESPGLTACLALADEVMLAARPG